MPGGIGGKGPGSGMGNGIDTRFWIRSISVHSNLNRFTASRTISVILVYSPFSINFCMNS